MKKGLMVTTLAEAAQWDAAVRSFQNYDVYYLSGYARAFQLHGDGEPLLFLYEGDGIRGIDVVMRRDIAKDPRFAGKLPEGIYFDLATPYGYGGWLLEGEGDPAPLFAAYEEWCRGNGTVSEFVRFHPLVTTADQFRPFYEPIPIRKTIGTDLAGFEDPVESEFTKKCRKKIRQVMNKGVTFRVTQAPEDIGGFRKIYESTMDRDGAGAYYYFNDDFFEALRRGLRDELLYVEALYEGKTVAAALDLTVNGWIAIFLSGTLREYLALSPACVLRYALTLWGKEHGCRMIHHGGGTTNQPEDSLYQFKKKFGQHTEFDFCVGRKVFLPDVYTKLTNMRTDLPEDSGFFPRYRA